MIRSLVGIAILSLVWGCGGGGVAENGDSAPGSPSSGPVSAAADPAVLPAGDGGRILNIPGDGAPSTSSGATQLTWAVDDGWVQVAPSNSMRLFQYRLPGEAGDGELVVFYFGPGQGGDPMANAARWAGQFNQADGSDSREKMQVLPLEGAKLETLLVVLSGDYTGGMSGAPIDDAMLLGGIVNGPDAPWFFKAVGPASTLQTHRGAFEAFLRSVRPAG